MKENSLYDKKSLKSVLGKTADFDELAKDCVAFSNAQGGTIDIGIEDGESEPSIEQTIQDGLATQIVNSIANRTNGVIVSAETTTANNGGQYIKLTITRNPNAVAMTSAGKTYIRIGDSCKPVGPEDLVRLVADKNSISWEDTVTSFSWKDADENKLDAFISMIRHSDRVSTFVKQKEPKELLDYFYMTEAESDYMTNLGVLFVGKQTQRGRILNAPVIQ